MSNNNKYQILCAQINPPIFSEFFKFIIAKISNKSFTNRNHLPLNVATRYETFVYS